MNTGWVPSLGVFTVCVCTRTIQFEFNRFCSFIWCSNLRDSFIFAALFLTSCACILRPVQVSLCRYCLYTLYILLAIFSIHVFPLFKEMVQFMTLMYTNWREKKTLSCAYIKYAQNFIEFQQPAGVCKKMSILAERKGWSNCCPFHYIILILNALPAHSFHSGTTTTMERRQQWNDNCGGWTSPQIIQDIQLYYAALVSHSCNPSQRFSPTFDETKVGGFDNIIQTNPATILKPARLNTAASIVIRSGVLLRRHRTNGSAYRGRNKQ